MVYWEGAIPSLFLYEPRCADHFLSGADEGVFSMNWAVIMAGGSGTRFWPLSHGHHPKQFLKLLGDETPAGACVKRLSKFIAPERILMVASCHHREVISQVLPEFPQDQILWEPVGRNTAACIAWVTEVIRRRDKSAKIGVFPSDHDISDEAAFISCLNRAYAAAENQIVLFGIAPDRPETERAKLF